MYAKKTLLVLFLCLTLFLGACVPRAEPPRPPETESSTTQGGESVSDGVIDANATESPLSNGVQEGRIAPHSSPFANGRAIVELGDYNSPWVIDTNGEKLFSICERFPGYRIPHWTMAITRTTTSGHLFLSREGNVRTRMGAVHVGFDEIITRIADRNGNIIVDVEPMGITGIMHSRLSSQISSDYLFVYSITEDFTGVILQIGVIDFDGNWVVPLSDSNSVSEARGHFLPFEPVVAYLGDGIAYIYRSDTNNRTGAGIYGALLNIRSGTWHEVSHHTRIEMGIFGRHRDNRFYNGVMNSINTGSWNNVIYTMTNTGEMSSINHSLDRAGAFSNGVVFARGEGNWGFFNANGERVIDLGGLAGDSEIYSFGFHSENALVFITNALGTDFFTLFDMQGNMLFEPIETDFRTSPRSNPTLELSGFYYSDGIILHESNGSIYAHDESGRQLFVINDVGILHGFSEGFALIRCTVNHYGYYIDKAGIRVIG